MTTTIGCLDNLPRCRLAHAPTPLEAMPNLSRHVGGAELFIKRDDCTGLALGGNKIRQLEYYVGAAEAKGGGNLDEEIAISGRGKTLMVWSKAIGRAVIG